MSDRLAIEDEITLGQLLDRSMSTYEKIIAEDSANPDTVQTRIVSTLSDLSLCAALISKLAILSTNETIEDINTSDLKCIAVDALRGMLQLLLKTSGGSDRKRNLEISKQNLANFINRVESFNIIPSDRVSQFKGPLNNTHQNVALRREMKIAQYKLEKQLKAQIDGYRARQEKRSRPALYATSSLPFEKTDPKTTGNGVATRTENDDDNDTDDDEERREAYVTWLRFLYLKAHQEIGSIDLELDLLGQGSQMSELPKSKSNHEKNDDDLSWRVERKAIGSDGPLISSSGKVLRPFTILPSQSSTAVATTDRIRLRAEVFRPDWNLPTMTIDEYLDEQKAMGNFISGGGPAQAEQETQGERDRKEAEEDNRRGEVKQEEMRTKAIEWDKFTDDHRKGEGNRLNRG
ncbi:TAP42-like protein [Phakopsora pachyrhizi]|nr:TAP42-like protein [Phakopsora pachyrhizi]